MSQRTDPYAYVPPQIGLKAPGRQYFCYYPTEGVEDPKFKSDVRDLLLDGNPIMVLPTGRRIVTRVWFHWNWFKQIANLFFDTDRLAVFEVELRGDLIDSKLGGKDRLVMHQAALEGEVVFPFGHRSPPVVTLDFVSYRATLYS